MAESCGTCKYFFALGPVCRKNPPALLMVESGRPGQAQFIGAWPPSKESNWCGEYKPDITITN